LTIIVSLSTITRMKELALIDSHNLAPSDIAKLQRRLAVRAVVFDADNKVALLHVRKNNYYKLPGGGIEPGEDSFSALRRECQEEIGCAVEINREIGSITEYRGDLNQTSYCYLAKVAGKKSAPAFTAVEKSEGFEDIWLPIDQAIETVSGAETDDEYGSVIRIRDAIFLREAEKQLKNK